MTDCTAPLIAVNARRTLRGFALEVEFESARARTVIYGPSGGGKSMTLRAIAGLASLSSGRIVVGDRILFDSNVGINVPAYDRRVGYVPQGYGLFPHLDVARNITFGMKASDSPSRRRVLDQMTELTGLQGLERRRISELSGGQQQRVAIARALAAQPRLLLLDEPFSALDPELRRALRDEVLAVQQRTGVPVVTVTHDVQDAFALGETMVVIDAGRVLQQGTRDEVFYRPGSRRVAQLLGIRNILPARILGGRHHSAIQCEWAGGILEAAAPAERFSPGAAVSACIRPAQIMVRRDEDPRSNRPNVLSGRIASETLLPEGYGLEFEVAGQPGAKLHIELPAYVYFRLGLDVRKEIEVSVPPEAIHLVDA